MADNLANNFEGGSLSMHQHAKYPRMRTQGEGQPDDNEDDYIPISVGSDSYDDDDDDEKYQMNDLNMNTSIADIDASRSMLWNGIVASADRDAEAFDGDTVEMVVEDVQKDVDEATARDDNQMNHSADDAMNRELPSEIPAAVDVVSSDFNQIVPIIDDAAPAVENADAAVDGRVPADDDAILHVATVGDVVPSAFDSVPILPIPVGCVSPRSDVQTVKDTFPPEITTVDELGLSTTGASLTDDNVQIVDSAVEDGQRAVDMCDMSTAVADQDRVVDDSTFAFVSAASEGIATSVAVSYEGEPSEIVADCKNINPGGIDDGIPASSECDAEPIKPIGGFEQASAAENLDMMPVQSTVSAMNAVNDSTTSEQGADAESSAIQDHISGLIKEWSAQALTSADIDDIPDSPMAPQFDDEVMLDETHRPVEPIVVPGAGDAVPISSADISVIKKVGRSKPNGPATRPELQGTKTRGASNNYNTAPRRREPFRSRGRSRSPIGRGVIGRVNRSPPRGRAFRSRSPVRNLSFSYVAPVPPHAPLCILIQLGSSQRRYTEECEVELQRSGIPTAVRIVDREAHTSLSGTLSEVVKIVGTRYVIIVGKSNQSNGTVSFKIVSDEKRESVEMPLRQSINYIIDAEHARRRALAEQTGTPYISNSARRSYAQDYRAPMEPRFDSETMYRNDPRVIRPGGPRPLPGGNYRASDVETTYPRMDRVGSPYARPPQPDPYQRTEMNPASYRSPYPHSSPAFPLPNTQYPDRRGPPSGPAYGNAGPRHVAEPDYYSPASQYSPSSAPRLDDYANRRDSHHYGQGPMPIEPVKYGQYLANDYNPDYTRGPHRPEYPENPMDYSRPKPLPAAPSGYPFSAPSSDYNYGPPMSPPSPGYGQMRPSSSRYR